jgi:mRNA-degrading endonuclease RelE of RelBE toxin-antitoxin system
LTQRPVCPPSPIEAEREVGDPALRQLLVYSYRLMYRVHDDHVVIRVFVHGARDFATWRQEEAPEI